MEDIDATLRVLKDLEKNLQDKKNKVFTSICPNCNTNNLTTIVIDVRGNSVYKYRCLKCKYKETISG